MNRRTAGFTLVELLVAMAMFALLAGAAISVFSAGTRSGAKSRRYKEMIARGQMALDSVCADIRAAVAQDRNTMTGLDAQYDGRDCDTLDCVIARRNPDRREPDEGGRSEVGYSINNDPSVGPVGLLRREDRTPDEDLLEGGKAALIAPFVSELNLEFYNGIEWAAGWSGSGFPKAVRIQVVALDEAGIESPLFLSTTVAVMAH